MTNGKQSFEERLAKIEGKRPAQMALPSDVPAMTAPPPREGDRSPEAPRQARRSSVLPVLAMGLLSFVLSGAIAVGALLAFGASDTAKAAEHARSSKQTHPHRSAFENAPEIKHSFVNVDGQIKQLDAQGNPIEGTTGLTAWIKKGQMQRYMDNFDPDADLAEQFDVKRQKLQRVSDLLN